MLSRFNYSTDHNEPLHEYCSGYREKQSNLLSQRKCAGRNSMAKVSYILYILMHAMLQEIRNTSAYTHKSSTAVHLRRHT